MGEAKRRRAAGVKTGWAKTPLSGFSPQLIEAMKHAYGMQGLAAFEVTERATALHEAGHAVVGRAIAGETPLSLTIGSQAIARSRSFGSPKIGLCEHSPGSLFNRDIDVRVEPPETVIEVAAFRIAGQAAEAVCDPGDYRIGSSLDEDLEAQMILNGVAKVRLGLSPNNAPALTVLTRIATANVLWANRKAVERVAAALIESHALDQPALAELLANVARADPPIGAWVLTKLPLLIAEAGGDVRGMMGQLAVEASPVGAVPPRAAKAGPGGVLTPRTKKGRQRRYNARTDGGR